MTVWILVVTPVEVERKWEGGEKRFRKKSEGGREEGESTNLVPRCTSLAAGEPPEHSTKEDSYTGRSSLDSAKGESGQKRSASTSPTPTEGSSSSFGLFPPSVLPSGPTWGEMSSPPGPPLACYLSRRLEEELTVIVILGFATSSGSTLKKSNNAGTISTSFPNSSMSP